jgi:hypothetical protein
VHDKPRMPYVLSLSSVHDKPRMPFVLSLSSVHDKPKMPFVLSLSKHILSIASSRRCSVRAEPVEAHPVDRILEEMLRPC